MTQKKIPIGISSCLLGEHVRFDSGHKKDAYIVGTLARYFEFHPFCPEVGIGLGVPRPAMRLIQQTDGVHCVVIKDHSQDLTERLTQFAQQQRPKHAELCGYIVKKDSPSCGMERVKIFSGDMPHRIGTGIYTQTLMQNYPLLPVEEEGRLGDALLRENFIQRVYSYYRWRCLINEGITVQKLTRFHARHKLIIMSHGDYQPLGRLLASATKENLFDIAEQYITELMKLLKTIATRNQHVNVLQHIQGYLKKELTADNKAELCEVIECYRRGEVPLIVPITLLKHHFRQSPDAYIEESYYMSPYPQQLQLLNQL